MLLEHIRKILPKNVNCIYIRQVEPLGLGHAVLCARPVVGNEPFAVLLADDFMTVGENQPSVLKQIGFNCTKRNPETYWLSRR